MNMTRGPVKTTCSTCGSTDLVSVGITMDDGGVRFWTCSMCEASGWERDGAVIPRDVALAHIPRR
jgi:formate dehydrogenase maturation protein FdhE